MKTLREMVIDLYDLHIPAVNAVLFKLESVEGALAAEEADPAGLAVTISRLSMKVSLLKEVVDLMWHMQFDKDC